MNDRGQVGACRNGVEALLDTGATKTVISSGLAKQLGGNTLSKEFSADVEGRKVPLKLVGVTLKAPGCHPDALAVIVDDTLAARAGRKDGKLVEVILGHDYLENKDVALMYKKKRNKQIDKVVCISKR